MNEILDGHFVNPGSGLGLRARAKAAQMATLRFLRDEARIGDEGNLRELNWITKDVLSDITLAEAFYESVSNLILSQSAARFDSFRTALRHYIQSNKRLGDPRIREDSANWRSLSPEAAQRYRQWLAHDNIRFFFETILPNSSENRRRKDFWLRYHRIIRDFQVGLSDADYVKVKASERSGELRYFARLDHQTTSAFLMRFDTYAGSFVVVEFSETGNAAYIFKTKDFEERGGSLQMHRLQLKRQLKFDDKHRIIHSGDWERKASYKLSMEFGIRP